MLSAVRPASGAVVAHHVLVVAPRFRANADLLAGLNLKAVDQQVHGTVRGSRVPGDHTGLTEVTGLWVAGIIADVTAQVMARRRRG